MPDPSTPHQAAHRSAPVILIPAAAYTQVPICGLQICPCIASMLSHRQEVATRISPASTADGWPLRSSDSSSVLCPCTCMPMLACLIRPLGGAGAVVARRAEHAYAVVGQRPRLGAPPARQRLQRGRPPPQLGRPHHLHAVGHVRGFCRGVLRLGARASCEREYLPGHGPISVALTPCRSSSFTWQ